MNKVIDPKRATSCGIIDLIRHKVFYGHIIQQLLKTFVGGKHPIDTLAVGKHPKEMLVKLYINTDFIKKMNTDCENEEQFWKWINGVLEHETLHIVFDHLSCSWADKTRGNVAVDCVVNSLIPKDHLPPNCIYPDNYGFPLNKSATWYYEQLAKNETYKKQCSSGAFGQGGIMSHVMSSHGQWGNAESNDPLLKEFIKDIVRTAKDLCNKDYGNIPAQVVAQIDEVLKHKTPMVPWNQVLRNFVASAMESNLDYTMKRESKRYGTRPGVKKEDVLNLAVAIDTSGSISDSLLHIFLSEINWIYRGGSMIHVYEADCAIAFDYVFKGRFTTDIHGRGGTDLEPVLKEVEGKYDALIYFTDFYAPPIEKKYGTPTLWVLTNDMPKEQWPVKWGRHVKIDVPNEGW